MTFVLELLVSLLIVAGGSFLLIGSIGMAATLAILTITFGTAPEVINEAGVSEPSLTGASSAVAVPGARESQACQPRGARQSERACSSVGSTRR